MGGVDFFSSPSFLGQKNLPQVSYAFSIGNIPGVTDRQGAWRLAFQVFDRNDDGWIEADEYRRVFVGLDGCLVTVVMFRCLFVCLFRLSFLAFFVYMYYYYYYIYFILFLYIHRRAVFQTFLVSLFSGLFFLIGITVSQQRPRVF